MPMTISHLPVLPSISDIVSSRAAPQMNMGARVVVNIGGAGREARRRAGLPLTSP
jgi:hypothetical protein